MPIDRVSQRREDQKRVENIKQAAVTLRKLADTVNAGDSDVRNVPELAEAPALREMADAVDFVLSKEGRNFIGRMTWKKKEQENPNFPLYMPEQLRADIKAAAVVAGANLEAEAERALKEFIAGRFTPGQTIREPRGQASKKVNLNIRVNAALRREAEIVSNDLLAQDEMTWAPRVSQILVSWFVDRLEEEFKNPVRRKDKPAETTESAEPAE